MATQGTNFTVKCCPNNGFFFSGFVNDEFHCRTIIANSEEEAVNKFLEFCKNDTSRQEAEERRVKKQNEYTKFLGIINNKSESL